MNNQDFDNKDFNIQENEVQNNQGFEPDWGFEQTPPHLENEKVAEAEKKAKNSMILGIVGLVVDISCCGIVGLVLNIISLVMAKNAKSILGYEHPDAKTGKICSIIGLVISALTIIVYILYLVLIILAIVFETNIHI